jgi:ABC-type dipeptide/oligopeptide/nickel transport system ATPase subunit
MLDEDQENTFHLVNNGHNLVISGQAGCGKSHLVRHIVQYKKKNSEILFSRKKGGSYPRVPVVSMLDLQ